MDKLKVLLLAVCLGLITGCGNYSFTGITVPTGTRTYQVNYFQNDAPLIEPGLERTFTNSLADLIQNQTSLQLVTSGGDIIYEGEITEYRISPTTATADITAAQNRLTIGVRVRYYEKNNPDNDLSQQFSFFYDYPAQAQLVGAQKDTAIAEIFERITQDILNATLAKW
ncbi:LPS assembly lipoprotein LptE [Gelidibacter japonicus]|uniref:LPS assembly lipoprotein LptE n=1 Tax=Gelidibacter japonicus TaxID=1962232 RepID=UPI0013D11D11|nr:LptE family protein [Gelidibacter japonicus]MCL8006780.1 LPS assembly lipoprotein LptE [Gelidibacter japonicus]